MGDEEEREDGASYSGPWRHSREHKLGDVGLTAYKAEIKNTMVQMGEALFSEFTTGRDYDWNASEPIRPVNVNIKQAIEDDEDGGYEYVESPFDEARDGTAFNEIHIVWRKEKAEYTRNKRKCWPFLMGTLNEEIKLDVMQASTFNEL
jgi:hypothetical protein